MAKDLERRRFLTSSLAGFGALSLGTSLGSMASSSPFIELGSLGAMGELLPPNDLGLRLPPGFTARVVARAFQPVSLAHGEESAYSWHQYPDGGACFSTDDGGWVYVSNSEVEAHGGGAGALRFNPDGELIDAYAILGGTTDNCAGGPTPWNTWLSCEETPYGQVFECDVYGKRAAVSCPGLGYFRHEAAAVDPRWHRVYLTEDERDGCLYRYTALESREQRFDFRTGLLEVASVDQDGYVSWLPVPNPRPKSFQSPTRLQVPRATHFDGGEGIWYHEGRIIFSTKGDNRIWEYDTNQNILKLIYDARKLTKPILYGVDNICVSREGEILVAEDGGDLQIVVLGPNRRAVPLIQLVGQDQSEIAGPALSPRGDKLYFSSQRGDRNGITYEVSGRFLKTLG
jgi:secreted PhoX family phosphatase